MRLAGISMDSLVVGGFKSLALIESSTVSKVLNGYLTTHPSRNVVSICRRFKLTFSISVPAYPLRTPYSNLRK